MSVVTFRRATWSRLLSWGRNLPGSILPAPDNPNLCNGGALRGQPPLPGLTTYVVMKDQLATQPGGHYLN